MEIGGDYANLRGDAPRPFPADLDGCFISNVWIVKAEHRHRRAHHIHRRGIFWRALDKIDNSIRQFSLTAQLIRAALQFLAIRQLVVPKKINNFLVTDFAGQLVDVVAAVNELALVADDVAQSRRVRDNAFESACVGWHWSFG